MRQGMAAACMVLGLVSSGIASAATVDSIKGKVSINRGQGFEVLAEPSSAKAGDAVMASPKGSARVVYSDQCMVTVEPGAVVVIEEETPCKTAVEGSYEPTGGSLKDTEPVVEENRFGYYFLGGLAVAVGAGCIVACGHDDDDASP